MIILWLFFSCCVGGMAKAAGKSFILWTFLSLICPLVGLILLIGILVIENTVRKKSE